MTQFHLSQIHLHGAEEEVTSHVYQGPAPSQ